MPWWERLESPITTYYLLLSATAMLVVIGLVMVLSASSVTSFKDTNSSYTVFLSQLQAAVVGIIGAFVATRIPLTTWKRASVPLLIGAIFLQALVFVPGLGVSVNGNRNWIQVAGQQVQPSEFAKVALVLFGATVLAKKRRKLGHFMHAVVPLVFPAGALLLLLVLGGKDLGTGLVLLAIIGGLLFAAGVPASLVVVVVVVSPASCWLSSPLRGFIGLSWLPATAASDAPAKKSVVKTSVVASRRFLDLGSPDSPSSGAD
jgi:cell division protein FtsW